MEEARTQLIELASSLALRHGFVDAEEAFRNSKRQMADLLERQDRTIIELAYKLRVIADSLPRESPAAS